MRVAPNRSPHASTAGSRRRSELTRLTSQTNAGRRRQYPARIPGRHASRVGAPLPGSGIRRRSGGETYRGTGRQGRYVTFLLTAGLHIRYAMDATDRDLMLAVREGDAEKFGLLFDRHQQNLFSFFYRLTGDAASSEDLVQDVFLRMLKYRKTFRPDSHF